MLNANANSVLPRVAGDVLARWIRGHTSQSPLVRAMLKSAGATITRPEALAPILEAVLLAFFCDEEDDLVVRTLPDPDSGDVDSKKVKKYTK